MYTMANSKKIFRKDLNSIFILSIPLLFSFFILSCAQTKSDFKKSNNDSKKPFAKIINESYILVIDTIVFKKKIIGNIFSKESKVIFDKIEVKKQFTIGEEKKVFYYVLLTDFSTTTRTCRWLNSVDNVLYLNDDFEGNDSFEQMYLTCIGTENCATNVYILDSKRFWLCGENPNCLREGAVVNCKVIKSMITN